MSMRPSDMNGSPTASSHTEPGGRVVRREIPRHRRTLNLTAWIGVRTPPAPFEPAAFEPTWRREPLPPLRGGAADRVVAWVGEKRTPLVGGALSLALVGALVGSSVNSPVAAEALQRSAGAPVQQAAQPPRPAPAVMSKPATSLARFAVSAGVSQVRPAVAGVTPGVPMALAAKVVPAAGSSTRSSAPGLAGGGEVSPAPGSPAPAARPASGSASPAPSPSPEPAASPAPSPSPAGPAVPAVAIPAVPLTAAEQSAADAAAAAALTAANALAAANLTKANALAAANLTAANAKAAADLTAANAAAAAAATAKAAADAAWAIAHP